jgi:hypothetical protein
MKPETLKSILASNNESKQTTYLTLLIDKCKDLDRQINIVALLMILLVFLFYLIDVSKPESLQIGPLEIKDLQSIKVYIPVVFSFLVLRNILIITHRTELYKIVKQFANSFFNLPFDVDSSEAPDEFTKTILPVSNYFEVGLSLRINSKFSCIGMLLIFPIIFIGIIPYVLLTKWIYDFLLIFEKLYFIEKVSIILSIWLTLISIYYFFHIVRKDVL